MKNCISHADDVQTQTDHVAELRELLGDDVLFLHWPTRSKGSKKKWGHLTVDAMNNPDYLEKLATGNIGVALGAKSGGLCAIDIDRDELVQPFVEANPILEDTLQTHGARGRVFWLQMAGDYPGKTVKLKTHSGDHCGEFRSNGSQSIISGTHPGGGEYKIVVHQRPAKIKYDSIDFSCFKQQLKTAGGEAKTPRAICKIAPTASVTSVTSVTQSLCKAEDAVAMALSDVEHANHSGLWLLARAVRTLEAKGTIHGRAQVIAVFDEWHRQAKNLGILRARQSRDRYLMEFFDAYKNVKFLLTENPVQSAWEAAQSEAFPPEAAMFEDDEAKRFVSLCFQMHKQADGAEWFIPSRKATTLFDVSHATICTWLRGLVALGILHQTKKHTADKSPRYKYQAENPKPATTKKV